MRVFAIVAIALFSGSVFASKARVNSLQGANHLIDTQTVFTAPSHILSLNPYMTYEMGAVGAGAEGGIMRSLNNGGKILFYLGHDNTNATEGLADLRTANNFIDQHNPLEVIYGMGNMAYGASVSMVDNKTAGTKETTVALKWGMAMGEDWVYAHVHAVSEAQLLNGTDKDKMNAAPFIKVGGSHAMDTLRVFGELDIGNGKYSPGAAGATSQSINDLSVTAGVEDRSLKTDIADIYYGIRAAYAERKAATKSTIYQVPAFLGIEYTATSWAMVRASVSQNILFGESEDKSTTPSTKSGIPANTTVAAGLGLKWQNLVLDGSLTAAGNGNINGNQFLSQASLTYNF